ncbi:hypothetical protein BX616_004303 [Lobosporangium transversale]|nr:hypothetical protein BX616_004303 [Lobosporangium transversale]
MANDPFHRSHLSGDFGANKDWSEGVEFHTFSTSNHDRDYCQQGQQQHQILPSQHQQYSEYSQICQQQRRLHQQQLQYLQQLRQRQSSPEDEPMTPLQVLRPHHPMVLQRTVSMPLYPTMRALQRQPQDPQLQIHSVELHQGQQRRAEESHASQHQSQAPGSPELDQCTLISHFQCNPSASSYRVSCTEQPSPSAELMTDMTTLGQNLSMFNIRNPALQSTIPILDQDIDLMLLSSLNLSAIDETHLLDQTEKPISSSMESPSLSWASASASRETSPSLSPNLTRHMTSPSSTEPSTGIEQSQSTMTATYPLATLSTADNETTVTKRRRRIRPPMIKKPKRIKPTSFPCMAPGCDKVFVRAYNLTSHMKTHSSERPFVCGVCPLAFARRHDCERHARLHTGEKPYSCQICGTGFMRNDALHRHLKFCGTAGSSFATEIHQKPI